MANLANPLEIPEICLKTLRGGGGGGGGGIRHGRVT